MGGEAGKFAIYSQFCTSEVWGDEIGPGFIEMQQNFWGNVSPQDRLP